MSVVPAAANQPAPSRHRRLSWLAVAAVVATALNLRPAVVSVSPVLSRIRQQLELSPAVAGLLTTVPLLCFGALAPLAPRVARRIGLEATVVCSLLLLAAGIAVRLLPAVGWLFVGSLLAGAAIAIANVLMPAVVKRDFPSRVGSMTGLYSGALNVGAGLAAGVSVPLTTALGGSWRQALAIWAVPALAAAAVWLPTRYQWAPRPRHPAHPRHPSGSQQPGGGAVRDLLRSRLAWLVTIYLGTQSFEFYAAAAWTPTVFVANGVSAGTAGLLLGWANLTGLVGALIAPTLAGRMRRQSGPIIVVVGFYILGLAGLLVAPAAAPWLWMTLFGIAQGAGFGLGLLLISMRAADPRRAALLSGMAQGVGYLVASLGPLTLGVVHGVTHEWHWPIGVLLAMLLPMTAAGWGAGRDRLVAVR